MKKYIAYFVSFVVAASTLFIVGCDKEENNPSGNSAPKKPTAPQVTVSGPNTTSNDPYALTAKSYAQMFSNIAMQFAPMQSQTGTQNGNVWVFEYTAGTLTIKYSATENSDGSVLWTITLNGTEDQVTYNNWKAFEAFISADGKNGYWKVFVTNSTTLEGEYTWSTAANGTVTGTIIAYTNGVETERAVIIANTDGSGELNFYQKVSGVTNLVLKTKITWQTNGSGTWTTYKNDGSVEATGSWT
ncbi:MAG: hypothetical protein AB1728_07575 [Bacteroidota bacterium]